MSCVKCHCPMKHTARLRESPPYEPRSSLLYKGFGSIVMLMIIEHTSRSSHSGLLVHRLQKMAEGPLGYMSALLSGVCVRETEVDALVNAGIDHIFRDV